MFELFERGEDDDILGGAKERARIEGKEKRVFFSVINMAHVVMFECGGVFNAILDIWIKKRERGRPRKKSSDRRLRLIENLNGKPYIY